MNQYQFEQIARTMERRYGKMKKGEEDKYAMLLFPMESNLLKVWRKHPDSNGRRLEEAILLALYAVKNYTDAEVTETAGFESPSNIRLRDALLASFDPFFNEKIREILAETTNMEDQEALTEYYRLPVRCILRIKDSVERWTRERGADGYFRFLEEWFGEQVPADDKMNYSVFDKTLSSDV